MSRNLFVRRLTMNRTVISYRKSSNILSVWEWDYANVITTSPVAMTVTV